MIVLTAQTALSPYVVTCERKGKRISTTHRQSIDDALATAEYAQANSSYQVLIWSLVAGEYTSIPQNVWASLGGAA